jgi:heme oxygenase
MGIRTALRQATALQHQSLEAHALIATLLQPDITLAQIVRIEQALAAYHAIAAAACAPWEATLGYAPFRHADILLRDLECFGSSPQDDLCVAVPALTSAADAAGYLYVAEGSLLGNRMIARHLAAHLPAYHRLGGQYYSDEADRINRHWKSLCAILEQFSGDPISLATLTARAQLTFAGIEACLERALSPGNP